MVSAARGLNSQIRKFVVLVATIVVWLFFQWLSGLVSHDIGVTLIELSVGVSSFIVISFLVFVYDYTRNQLSRNMVVLLSLVASMFLLLSVSGLTITEVNFEDGAPSIANVSGIYWLQIAFIISMALVAAQKLQARISHSRVRADLLLLIALVQALFFSLLASTVFASSQQAQLFIPVSLLLMCGIIYYAIAKHRLFDVRLIVARTLGYVLSTVSAVGLYAGSAVLVAGLFFANSVELTQILFFAVFSVITALAFQPFKRFFDRATNRIFYRDAYEPETFLAEVNKVVVSEVDVDILLRHISDLMVSNLKTEFAVFEVHQTAYMGRRRVGDNKNGYSRVDLEDLEKLIASHHDRVLTAFEAEDNQPEIYDILRAQNVAVVAKLAPVIEVDSSGYGLLLLGAKKSGNQFTRQDVSIIRIIAGELSIAVQNGLRYEEIEKFNTTLQEKVDDATKRLKKTNDKLRSMDETKDEFISMASHQLRTPLTSVKGYVSMVLEGDAGDLNPMQRKLLEQAFTSSQRMVFLIADLLNLSRLRTGKFIVDSVPTNLAEVIQGEVEQLKETAAGRSLTLEYTKPESFPTLMLDETKIRQVIMNFVDNAIYYTQAGGSIEIKLIETPKSVEFKVADNGIGVPKAEQHHLFNKFYRARNAQKARPDGTGLGLFMAKKVIVAQGGAILFNSKEGKGSTFGFSFSKAKLLAPQETK